MNRATQVMGVMGARRVMISVACMALGEFVANVMAVMGARRVMVAGKFMAPVALIAPIKAIAVERSKTTRTIRGVL